MGVYLKLIIFYSIQIYKVILVHVKLQYFTFDYDEFKKRSFNYFVV